MIRMIQCQSTDHAKNYFKVALEPSDYYVNDHELQGQFHGRLAERLGISGDTTRDTFFALCENRNPVSGKPLTRITRGDRTIFYDINFHAPKSVSILCALSKDTHIQDVFNASVLETMKDIERDMLTRVRVGNVYEDRKTEELVFAEFTHLTARPVANANPDIHVHSHCTVFNATYDPVEQKIKAGQFRDIKRDMPYYQSRFHKILSDKLIDLGYSIKKTANSFEIDGVPKDAIDLMSKRTNAIGQYARENGITDLRELSELGARTRSAKKQGMSLEELKADWKRQLMELPSYRDDRESRVIRYKEREVTLQMGNKECVGYAVGHAFERASVIPERRLLANAYSHSIGHRNITLNSINDEFAADTNILKIEEFNRVSCTTLNILREEQHMVKLARKGMGQLMPLYNRTPEIRANDEQGRAIEHIITTKNRVSIVKGGAGTGKTTLMTEAVEWIEKAGKQVIVVAPSSQASRSVLRGEGFQEADTVSKLLIDKELQAKLNGNVLWVDEAGLLSNSQMIDLLELAIDKNARLILGGDTMQHSAVLRGDSLRILNVIGGVKAAEVNKIYRQKDEQYRIAVEYLSKGNVTDGFNRLDSIGAVKEIDPLKPNEQLVLDYVSARKKGKSALIVSPTHAQGEAVTKEVRTKLKSSGVLGKRETQVAKLKNLNMTEAEKSDWRNYTNGQFVQFSQNASKIKRGSIWQIQNVKDGHITLKDKFGETRLLPADKAKNFEVYRRMDIGMSKGDEVRITHNCFDKNGKRLDNGQSLIMNGINKSGEMILINQFSKTAFVLDKEFGHIDHNYFSTSHASQGKTVDEIFISQPAGTFVATDAKQFYVSVSRGREAAHIYTDDKFALLEHAAVTKQRQSALELLDSKNISMEHIKAMDRHNDFKNAGVNRDKVNHKHYEDYEPGI